MSESTLFLDGRVALHAGDCLDVLPTLEAESIDSVVCDPPYHLTNNVGSRSPNPGQYTPIGKPKEPKGGFMGKQWDGGDVAFRVETWAAILRVLKPGGHLVAFSGTRTYHRMVCAIEDAGFEIRDQLAWIYGSGFPKSHDVSKGIDRAAGVEREVVGSKLGLPGYSLAPDLGRNTYSADGRDSEIECAITAPATDAARQWQGFGTALKPAHEPIVLARKPLIGTVVANVLKFGCGALNIDGTRINSGGESERCPIHGMHHLPEADEALAMPSIAREVADDLQPGVPLKADEPRGQSELDRGNVDRSEVRLSVREYGTHIISGLRSPSDPNAEGLSGASARDGSPSEARSPNRGTCSSHQRGEGGQSTGEPNLDGLGRAFQGASNNGEASVGVGGGKRKLAGCTCRQSLGRWPANLVHDGSPEVLAGFPDVHGAGSACDAKWDGNKRSVYGKYEGGLHGSRLGDSGSAARFFYTVKPDLPPAPSQPERYAPVSDSAGDGSPKDGTSELLSETCGKRFHYTAKADADDRLGSKHPTVKPLDLMQWLVRLVTPPGGLCLDPFAGTGTTGEAAFREGMRAVLIEREAEYIKDIKRRMALCLAGPVEREHQSTKARQGDSKLDHGPLFGGSE